MGEGAGGGARSQQRGSETALIGRGWSCGGRKGEGITCGSAANGGGAPGRGPAGSGKGGALGALGLGPGGADPRSCTPGEKGWGSWGLGAVLSRLGVQRKPRIQEGDSRCLGRAWRGTEETIPSLVLSTLQGGEEADLPPDQRQFVSLLPH